MRFNTRSEFIEAQSSEKLTLVHVHARQRLYVFSGPSSNVYSKIVPYFVSDLKQDDNYLVRVNSLVEVDAGGKFYYDIKSSTLYVRPVMDANPKSVEMIVTYRFFFSNVGLTTTWNLENLAEEVFYDGRIKSSPGYNHKIGIDQSLTSLVGSGTLSLVCSDGDLDGIFDTLIFENQSVEVYSWNRDLNPEDAQIIYRGRITNKSFDTDTLSFTVKDPIFELLSPPQLEVYSDTDNVSDSVKGQYKRLVYGRVDGLKCQSVDQIANGFKLTGTVQGSVETATITGTGTLFLTEVFQNDELNIGTQRFSVEQIISNTELIASNEPEFGFTLTDAFNVPSRATTLKNRAFIATGHVCAQSTKTVLTVNQLNRVTVDNIDGLFPGDFIEFVSTGERIEIKNTAPGNIIVLRQNMINRPSIGSTAIRRPIQKVYINGKIVPSEKYTISNALSCGLTFDADTEIDLAPIKTSPVSLNFTNGSRLVTYTMGGDFSISEVLTAMDLIKPDSVTYTTFYPISYIDSNNIWLNTPFADPTIVSNFDYKAPEYIVDDTTISVDILGKTENGLESGIWISTVAQAQRDLLRQASIEYVNEQSFVDGAIDGNQLVSIAIPESFSSKSLETTKVIIDKLNKSISSSLTLDVDLNLKFQVLNVFVEDVLPVVGDFDVIDWNIKTTNGKIYNRALARYRFTDVDNSTLDNGNKLYDFSSQYVNRYIEAGKTNEISLYLYKEFEAKISAHRNVYQNRLSVSTVTIKTDLRLEYLELGDIVILDFSRLYKRFGDNESRKKIVMVSSKNVTGQSITFEMTDLGNTFNTSSYITPNDAPEWTLAEELDKLKFGYITDNQGIVNDEESTAGVHLIS